MTAVGFKIRLRKNKEYFIRVKFATQREGKRDMTYNRGSSLTNKQCFKCQKVTEKERAGAQKRDREGSCLTDKLLFKIWELKTDGRETERYTKRGSTSDIQTIGLVKTRQRQSVRKRKKERKSQTAASYDTGLCDTTTASPSHYANTIMLIRCPLRLLLLQGVIQPVICVHWWIWSLLLFARMGLSRSLPFQWNWNKRGNTWGMKAPSYWKPLRPLRLRVRGTT